MPPLTDCELLPYNGLRSVLGRVGSRGQDNVMVTYNGAIPMEIAHKGTRAWRRNIKRAAGTTLRVIIKLGQ